MTGLRPDSTRILANQIAVRDTMPDAVTLPQLFRTSGWHSSRFGKMYHMDVPASVGTNKWDDPPSWDVAVSPPGAEQRTEGEKRDRSKGAGAAAWEWVSFKGEGKDQADNTAAELAMETMDKRRGGPFFIGLGFLRPHVPSVAPARFFDLYPRSTIQVPQNPPGDRDDIQQPHRKCRDAQGAAAGAVKRGPPLHERLHVRPPSGCCREQRRTGTTVHGRTHRVPRGASTHLDEAVARRSAGARA